MNKVGCLKCLILHFDGFVREIKLSSDCCWVFAGNDHLTKAIAFSGPELCLLALEGNFLNEYLLIFVYFTHLFG